MIWSIDDVIAGAQLLWNLPSFIKHPISVSQARTVLRARLENREANFLHMVRQGVYQNPRSPYLRLLNRAGCNYGDLRELVTREGVEQALMILFRNGVYLTVDEYKGRTPVVRGTDSFQVHANELTNPSSTLFVRVHTSGSRGSRTFYQKGLLEIQAYLVNHVLSHEVRGSGKWVHSIWGVPGSAAINQLLILWGLGRYPEHWFTHIDPADSQLDARYRWAIRVIRWGSRLGGIPFPSLSHASLDTPLPVARWISDKLRTGAVPNIRTYSSSAVRVCQAASSANIDLSGAKFVLSGEPITAARLAIIKKAGAEAFPHYGNSETGMTGQACLAPNFPDEVHVFSDYLALIQSGYYGADNGLPPTALLVSTLLDTASLILLNVSLGDQAVVQERRCGCPMERLGWATHLHTVRSYEKLTAGGMTFMDRDVIKVLEEVLPERFGGDPTHYQLVEQEDETGNLHLKLFVHPSIGPIDSASITETFLASISAGSGLHAVMGNVWRDGKFIDVERRPPAVTDSGKILHLHVQRRA